MERKVVQFTTDDQSQLDRLILKLFKDGTLIKGLYGANTYTVYTLYHDASEDTIINLLNDTRAKIKALDEIDEELQTERNIRTLDFYNDLRDYLRLILRQQRYNEVLKDNKRKAMNTKKEMDAIKESTMTPEEKYTVLEAQYNKLLGIEPEKKD